MDLQELVSTVENLTDGCQQALWEALKEILYRQKGPAKLKPSTDLDCIVKCGVLVSRDGRYDVPEAAKKGIRKLYTYLVRKYGTESYFDPETCQIVDIPKGATFVATVSAATGKTTLCLQFPNDEITELLDLFGTNRCKNK